MVESYYYSLLAYEKTNQRVRWINYCRRSVTDIGQNVTAYVFTHRYHHHHHRHHHHLCLTSLVSHSWGRTWYDSRPLMSILCHIFRHVQLPHVSFHYLTPGLLWPTYWPSTLHLQLHRSPKYAILIFTLYITKPSQPRFL